MLLPLMLSSSPAGFLFCLSFFLCLFLSEGELFFRLLSRTLLRQSRRTGFLFSTLSFSGFWRFPFRNALSICAFGGRLFRKLNVFFLLRRSLSMAGGGFFFLNIFFPCLLFFFFF